MLKQALILHTRAYGETSLLIDFFTLEQGYISVIARGAKRQKSSWRGILQPFTPLLIDYVGRSELQTLTKAEVDGAAINLSGNNLLSALYLNELLIRVLVRQDPYPSLYKLYFDTLCKLGSLKAKMIEPLLRCFELTLLQELGYALQLECVAATNEPVQAEAFYQFSLDAGIIPLAVEYKNLTDARINTIEINKVEANKNRYPGKSLLAIAKRDFSDATVLRDAKRLLRVALRLLLGDKPLNSRQLFVRKRHGPTTK